MPFLSNSKLLETSPGSCMSHVKLQWLCLPLKTSHFANNLWSLGAAAATGLRPAPALVTWHHLHANWPVRGSSGRPAHTAGPRCAARWQVWRDESQEAPRNAADTLYVCVSPRSLYGLRMEELLSLACWRLLLLFSLFVCLWLTSVPSRISTSLLRGKKAFHFLFISHQSPSCLFLLKQFNYYVLQEDFKLVV